MASFGPVSSAGCRHQPVSAVPGQWRVELACGCCPAAPLRVSGRGGVSGSPLLVWGPYRLDTEQSAKTHSPSQPLNHPFFFFFLFSFSLHMLLLDQGDHSKENSSLCGSLPPNRPSLAERGGWKSQVHGWRETGGKGSECTDVDGGRSWVCNMLLTLSHTLLSQHPVKSHLNTQLFLSEQGADSWMAYLCVCMCVCVCVCRWLCVWK